MNPPCIKRALLFISMTLFSSTAVSAAQIADPAASQKKVIDQMHHQLHDAQSAFKGEEKQALKELNEMTIREDVVIEDLNAKVAELMAAKTQIMRLRYAHLVEMRAILTDEQKILYDKGVLKRSSVK